MRVALAQLAPVWLNRLATTARIVEAIDDAAAQGAALVCFGEALLPGYPFWVERTDGAVFESHTQKAWHALYQREAVDIERGDLDDIASAARRHSIAVYIGIIERPLQRGGHSLYASLVYIDATGHIASAHRKLMPTYDERLVWSTGDGHGLRTHALHEFTVGGLNCWENWMPLARSALYAQGENLHVAVWPGSRRNTEQITPFIAREARACVISVSGLMRPQDIPDGFDTAPLGLELDGIAADGGSCIAAPDGSWIVEPIVGVEAVVCADLDIDQVRRERHNFDPSGHYARPDVLSLTVDRRRQKNATFRDD